VIQISFLYSRLGKEEYKRKDGERQLKAERGMRKEGRQMGILLRDRVASADKG
jgi:hypothetical protein